MANERFMLSPHPALPEGRNQRGNVLFLESAKTGLQNFITHNTTSNISAKTYQLPSLQIMRISELEKFLIP